MLNNFITVRHGNKSWVKIFIESGDIFYNNGFALLYAHSAKNGVFVIKSNISVGSGIAFVTAGFTCKGFCSGRGKNDVRCGNFERNSLIFRRVYGEHFSLVVINIIIYALEKNYVFMRNFRFDKISVGIVLRFRIFKLRRFRIAGTCAQTVASVHNLRTAADGYCCVDWNAEELARGRDACFGGDMEAMAEAYYAAVAEVAALRPTILGHVDLITKLNADNRFFDEASKRYQAAALDALHSADPAATVLEINTGAMARGYRQMPYPAQFLLKEWKRMGGKIILTADAHSADGVLYGYETAAAWAEAAGFDRAALLTVRGFVDCALR